MQRRIESGVVVLIGVGLIALALITQLFTRAPAFEELTDDFRPLMTEKAIATMHSDLEGMQAMTAEMRTEMLPDIAAAMGMEVADVQNFITQNFPATINGLEQLPEITREFTAMAHTLSLQRENFEAADEIPTGFLPATVFPWGLVAVGVLAIGVGFFMFRTAHLGSYLALGLGIVMIGAALMMSWPSKTSKADDLNVALRNVMTTEQVERAQGALATVGDMGTEMNTQMLPGLAAQMNMTESEMAAFVTGNYPAIGAMFEAMDEVQGRFDGMVTTMVTNVDNYDTIKPLSLEPVNWTFIAAGLLIAIAGGVALFAPAPVWRHRPAVPVH